MKALIIGGGAAGCAAAHLLSRMGGWEITLVEQAPFLGAGIRTSWYGGHPYTFGPRHFLTQNEDVYHYLNTVLPLRRCQEHEFWSYVAQDQNFYSFPIHVDDIERMPEKEQIYQEWSFGKPNPPANLKEYWTNSVGPTLYKKFIEKYSRKMWGVEADAIDTFNWSPKGTPLKSGPRQAWDTAISAYPYAHDGYNSWLDHATAGAKVLLSTRIESYDFVERRVRFDGEFHQFDIIVSTISPDIPFGFAYGHLPYIGRDFHKIVLPVEFALPPNVYFIYETGDEQWTRVTEFKKFTRHQSWQTLIGVEVPSRNGRHYPLPIVEYQNLAERYYQLMGPGVYCLGRNGSYRYSLDIAGCIEQAMELVEVLRQGGQDHPVVGAKWRL